MHGLAWRAISRGNLPLNLCPPDSSPASEIHPNEKINSMSSLTFSSMIVVFLLAASGRSALALSIRL